MQNNHNPTIAAVTTTSDHNLPTGVSAESESADRAFAILHERGYSDDDINLMRSDKTRQGNYTGDGKEIESEPKALKALGIGTAIGGAIGAIIGIFVTLGTSLFIPPEPGMIFSAGPTIVGLAGICAITGGIIGAMVGFGVPEERAKPY